MLLQIAWRNIWRSKMRSFVVITAVCLGLVCGVFALGIMYGMVNQRVRSIIQDEVSHIQIHNPSFSENYEMEYVVPGADALMQQLQKNTQVASVCSRLRLQGMASTAAAGTGVTILGVDPLMEAKVTGIHSRLIQGTYLKGKRNPMVISQRLADKLKVKLRSKIVITIQTIQGDMTYGAFRVVGIFKTSNSAFDKGNVFVDKRDLAKITGFQPQQAHEFALLLNSMDDVDVVQTSLQTKFPQVQVQSWKQIQPDLAMITQFMAQSSLFFLSVILLALAFGIVNTMLMVVLERRRELGMLMAIGMTPRRVFVMIITESVLLCLVGGIIGMGISLMLIQYFARVGIDLSAFADGFESVGYSAMVYPELSGEWYFIVAVMVVGMGIGGAVYPALKGVRTQVARAMRGE